MCVYAGIERCNCCRACILHTVLSRSDALPDALCVVTVPISLFLFLSHLEGQATGWGQGWEQPLGAEKGLTENLATIPDIL